MGYDLSTVMYNRKVSHNTRLLIIQKFEINAVIYPHATLKTHFQRDEYSLIIVTFPIVRKKEFPYIGFVNFFHDIYFEQIHE